MAILLIDVIRVFPGLKRPPCLVLKQIVTDSIPQRNSSCERNDARATNKAAGYSPLGIWMHRLDTVRISSGEVDWRCSCSR